MCKSTAGINFHAGTKGVGLATRLLQIALQSYQPSTLHSQAPRGRFLTLLPIALCYQLLNFAHLTRGGKKSTEALICIPLILNEVKPHPGDLSLLIFFPFIFFTHFLLVFFIV